MKSKIKNSKLQNLKNIKLLNTLAGHFQTLTSGSEKPLVGIDIGSYAIKLVHFSGSGGNIKIKNWAYRPYKFAQDAPASEKKVAITQDLQEIVKEFDLTGKPCAVSVSGNSVIIRYVAISQTNRQDIKKILASEAEPFIPFDIKDVNLDCHILGDTKQGKQAKTEIVLIAAKKDLIKSKLDLINSAKLKPVVVDIDAFTLENLCQKLKITGEEGGVLVLNIGHRFTNLTIIEKSMTRVARDVVISGQSFTKSIAKVCEIDYEKAENLKRQFGVTIETTPTVAISEPPQGENSSGPQTTSENIGSVSAITEDEKYRIKVSDCLKQNLKDLSAEIRRSIDFYYSQGKDRSISRAYLAGGSGSMPNIDKFLAAQLNMPVEILTPLYFTRGKGKKAIDDKTAPALCVACGLALRKMWDWV